MRHTKPRVGCRLPSAGGTGGRSAADFARAIGFEFLPPTCRAGAASRACADAGREVCANRDGFRPCPKHRKAQKDPPHLLKMCGGSYLGHHRAIATAQTGVSCADYAVMPQVTGRSFLICLGCERDVFPVRDAVLPRRKGGSHGIRPGRGGVVGVKTTRIQVILRFQRMFLVKR